MDDALHERRASWLPASADEALVIDESAAVAAPTVVSLPYWQPPARRTDGPAEIFEAMGPGEDGEVLLDAAAGSFSDLVTLEVVLGNDDRVKVDRALLRRNPWRQICALRIRSATGKAFVGTGWYIAPRVLATAGHCVFMQKEGGWARSIEVIPARHGGEAPYGRTASERFGSVAGWVDQGLRQYDYGVIFLADEEPGRAVGNFEVRDLGDSELRAGIANISGYPADRDRAEYQYFHARELRGVSPAQLDYEIDTYGGQSGSPIWLDRGAGQVIAVGIHTTGSQVGNSGTRISAPVIDNLIAWAGGQFQ